MPLLRFFCCWLPNNGNHHIDELFESCLFRKDQKEIVQVMANNHQTPASMAKLRRPSDGCTLLLVASIAGDATLVELLLQEEDEQRQQVVVVDTDGNSPLLCACLGGHFAVVVLLLKSKSSGMLIITRANHEGTTPLMAAAWRGHLELVKLLLTHPQHAGVMPSLLTQQDAMGRTAKDLAKEWGHEHVVKWIDDQQKLKEQR